MKITLQDKLQISGTHWIEFNISGTLNKHEHWAEDSKYLDEESYQLISDIFKKHSEDFNYYGATSYTTFQLKNIRQDIVDKGHSTDYQDLIALLDFCIQHNKTLWLLGL